jgi:hypothetical protein
MEIHLKITGGIMIALSLLHIGFPSRFGWKTDLAALSLLNRQMMYVHTFFVALIVLLMGLLCVCYSSSVIQTDLGKVIATGMAMFWGLRLLFQFFVYSPALWRGKSFETTVHIVFSILWLYFTVVFTVIALGLS